jgi:hypothetical protein
MQLKLEKEVQVFVFEQQQDVFVMIHQDKRETEEEFEEEYVD